MPGCLLGSLWFLIFINDFPHPISCNVRLFADDYVPFSELDDNDHLLLQNDLLTIPDPNLDKCKFLTYSRSPPRSSNPYYLNRAPLST